MLGSIPLSPAQRLANRIANAVDDVWFTGVSQTVHGFVIERMDDGWGRLLITGLNASARCNNTDKARAFLTDNIKL